MAKATKNLDKIRRLHAEGRATDKALADASANVVLATKALKDATLAAERAAADAAKTSVVAGFYGDAQIDVKAQQNKQQNTTTQNTASQVAAMKDITFNAGNDMKQIGSTILSAKGDVEYNVNNDLTLLAGESTSNSSAKNTKETLSANISSKQSVDVAISGSTSKSSSNSLHYENTGTMAADGDIKYNIGNNMKAEGYNAIANNIVANIGGDLELKSKQNIDSSNGNGYSLGGNIMVTRSKDLGGWGVNGGISSSSHNREWVDDVTSLIGTESVDINVGGKLGMEGSLIANIGTDGEDKGNLNIKAGSIEIKDIYNKESNSESEFSFGHSEYKPGEKDKNDGYSDGSNTATMKDLGNVKTGVTQATIGKGNIEIADGSDISSINRDVDKVQIVLKDITTGALDTKITFTNDIFDKDVGKMLDNVINDFNLLSDDNKKAFANILDTYTNYVAELNKYNNEINSENSLTPAGDSKPPRMGQDKYSYDQDGNIKKSPNGKDTYSNGYLDAVADANPEIVNRLNITKPSNEDFLANNEIVDNYYSELQQAMDNGKLKELKPSITSKFDDNPILEFMYKHVWGAAAVTDVHDKTMDDTIKADIGKNTNIQKMGTIPISFITTFISLTAGNSFASE